MNRYDNLITNRTAKLPGDLALPPLAKKNRRSKYNNVPTVVDGIRFASQAEAKRYGELRLLEREEKIGSLQLQPRYVLEAGIVYVADFAYFEGDNEIAEDVKGGRATQTALFKVKAKLFRKAYPNIELRIVK